MSAPCPVHGEHPVHADSAPAPVPEPGSATGPVGRSRRIRNPLTWLLVWLVRGYQLIVSPWFAPTCRYYPSCSAYGLMALREHGALKGFALTVWRVLRCNPWSRGGVDHVPPRRGRDEQRCTCDVALLTAPPAPARTLVPRNSDGSTTGNPLRGHPAR